MRQRRNPLPFLCPTANTVPTAEGAIQLAMENMPITIHACRALVIGYGRVGRLLADRLRGLGAFVSVAARRYEQLAWAEADGCTVQRLGDMGGWLCGYDLIVNTVPARVLTEELLSDLKASCLVIDVASKPGGADVGMGLWEKGSKCEKSERTRNVYLSGHGI